MNDKAKAWATDLGTVTVVDEWAWLNGTTPLGEAEDLRALADALNRVADHMDQDGRKR